MFFEKEQNLIKRMYKACDGLHGKRFATITDKVKNFSERSIDCAYAKGLLRNTNPESLITAVCLVPKY